jgi:hypothetical protein
MSEKTEISRADIITMQAYAAERDERRRRITALKHNRRVAVGPDATFYFENYQTMWHQVHEMLYIEGGGDDQIDDELNAYNPLIPKGQELVATLMFEIDDEHRRKHFLAGLGGVETAISIRLSAAANAAAIIPASAETDVDRATAEGKASAVQFLHFPFTPAQITRFRDPATEVVLAINHQKYGHMTILSAPVRASLAADFFDPSGRTP